MRTWPKLRSFQYYKDAFCPDRYFGSSHDWKRIPIFIYHALTPSEFENHLIFLKRNGYVAVSCEEAQWDRSDLKQVILTFDDGRRSVWTIAYPLLKKYGFKGTAFVSPGLIKHGNLTPRIDNAPESDLTNENYGNSVLFNWEEALEMHESSVIDMQLHGFAHSRIFTSSVIREFSHPGMSDTDLGISAWQVAQEGSDVFLEQFELGQPVYEHGSRWGGELRYFDDEGIRKMCIDYVRANNNDGQFFEKADWADVLRAEVSKFKEKHGENGRLETRREQRENLIKILREATSTLHANLGKQSEHFALPWARGNKALVEDIVSSVGIRHVYWAHLEKQHAGSEHRNIVSHHARLKDAFLLRLSGRQRQSLLGVVLDEYQKIRGDKKISPKKK